MSFNIRAAKAAAVLSLALTATTGPAQSGSDFGHRSDPEACMHPSGKSPDEMILACWKAINSHMMNRNGVAFALNNLAVAYRQKDDSQSALSALNAAIKIEGDTWQAMLNRGGVYMRMGNPDLALADFNRAVALNPHQPVCFRMRGEYYLERGDYDLAIADFTRSVLLDPKDAKALFLRASARQRRGDASLAAEDLAQAREIDPNVGNADNVAGIKSAIPW